MNKKIKYIIIILLAILIIAAITIFIILKNQTQEVNQEINKEPKQEEENVLVIGMEKNEQQNEAPQNTTELGTQPQEPAKNQVTPSTNTSVQPEPEPEPEQPKDASTLTQEIYDMNTTIGKLYIPKTKINISVYSNSDTKKMEKMPAFLYTSGGLNQTGITLFVGHNKRNGKIFSNNKKLEVGDIFYFTDYNGIKKKYTIYSKFITTSDDTSYLNTNVDSPTIVLSCCTDASDDNRIIVIGRAD